MNRSDSNVLEMLGLIGQIAITMLVPIFFCTFLSIWIGDLLDATWLSVVGFLIGSIAGFGSVYRIIAKYLRQKKRPGQLAREREEQDEDTKEIK